MEPNFDNAPFGPAQVHTVFVRHTQDGEARNIWVRNFAGRAFIATANVPHEELTASRNALWTVVDIARRFANAD